MIDKGLTETRILAQESASALMQNLCLPRRLRMMLEGS